MIVTLITVTPAGV